MKKAREGAPTSRIPRFVSCIRLLGRRAAFNAKRATMDAEG
jgi:hypothetical protein